MRTARRADIKYLACYAAPIVYYVLKNVMLLEPAGIWFAFPVVPQQESNSATKSKRCEYTCVHTYVTDTSILYIYIYIIIINIVIINV